MKNINLRDLYPEYELDCFVEVPDGDAEAFIASMTKEAAEIYFDAQRAEHSYDERRRYHKAYYSLDRDDGIEKAAHAFPSPEDIFEGELVREQLSDALSNLSDKQRRRMHAHFILGMSKVKIAKAEKVDEKVVRVAIERGLGNLKKFLES